uniref:Uncharacterized protein n=1 Tax=Anguilla anguilla TaxID=7936 RepID=A0A0E9VXR1_ANGAN
MLFPRHALCLAGLFQTFSMVWCFSPFPHR